MTPLPRKRILTATLRDSLARRPFIDTKLDQLRGRMESLRCSTPTHRNEQTNLFFIIGSGRSGTTLLRRILMSSQDVYIPPELQGLPTSIRWYRRHAHMDWESLVTGCLAFVQFHSTFEHARADLTPFYQAMRKAPERDRSLCYLLSGLYRYLAHVDGRDGAYLYGDKTPGLTRHAHRVLSVFPDAKFVHVLRDPFDVACSFAHSNLRPLEDAAALWVHRTRSARKLVSSHPERCLTVRYEELVTDPRAVASRVSNFIGLRSSRGLDVDAVEHLPAMRDGSLSHHQRLDQPVTSTRVGIARAVLDRDQLARLERIVGKEARRWGYADSAPHAG